MQRSFLEKVGAYRVSDVKPAQMDSGSRKAPEMQQFDVRDQAYSLKKGDGCSAPKAGCSRCYSSTDFINDTCSPLVSAPARSN